MSAVRIFDYYQTDDWVVPDEVPLPVVTDANVGKLVYKDKTLLTAHRASEDQFHQVGTKYRFTPISSVLYPGDFVIISTLETLRLPPTVGVDYQMSVRCVYYFNWFRGQTGFAAIETNGDDPAVSIQGFGTNINLSYTEIYTFVFDPRVDPTEWKIHRSEEFPLHFTYNTAVAAPVIDFYRTRNLIRHNFSQNISPTYVSGHIGRLYHVIHRNLSFGSVNLTLPTSQILMGIQTNPIVIPSRNYVYLQMLRVGNEQYVLITQSVELPTTLF